MKRTLCVTGECDAACEEAALHTLDYDMTYTAASKTKPFPIQSTLACDPQCYEKRPVGTSTSIKIDCNPKTPKTVILFPPTPYDAQSSRMGDRKSETLNSTSCGISKPKT